MPIQLEVRDVSVAYDGAPIVHDVSFVLETGTIGCLLGPSGCGKTTLLRAVAGFEQRRQQVFVMAADDGHVGISRLKLLVVPEPACHVAGAHLDALDLGIFIISSISLSV